MKLIIEPNDINKFKDENHECTLIDNLKNVYENEEFFQLTNIKITNMCNDNDSTILDIAVEYIGDII